MRKSIFCLLVVLSAVFASTTLEVDVVEDATDYGQYSDSLVRITADVFDARGDGVLGLELANFSITTPADTAHLVRDAESFYQSEYGVAVILCLDASGSMRGQPMTDMKDAVCSYLDSLRVQDRAAIVVFHDDVEKIADFSNDIDYLKRIVRDISHQGSITELFYAVHSSIGYFDQAADIPQRRLLIVISDGKDEGEAYTLDDCVERARDIGVPIHTIGFAEEENRSYLRILENLSDRTGGRYNEAENSSDLERQLSGTIDYLKSRYLVKFHVSDSLVMDSEQQYRIDVDKGNLSGWDDFQIDVPPEAIADIDTTGQAATSETAGEGPNWVYFGAAGIVILLVAGIIIYARRSVRQREEEFQKRQEELDESLREANKRAEEAQRNAEGAPPGKPDAESQQQVELPEDVPAGPEDAEGESSSKSGEIDDVGKADLQTPSSHSVHRRTVVGGSAPDAYEEAELIVMDGQRAGASFPLRDREITIGRASDNLFVLGDDTVSSHHAVIRNAGGIYQVTDLDSTNGTFVNGAAEKSAILKDGDVIKLGTVRIRFEAR